MSGSRCPMPGRRGSPALKLRLCAGHGARGDLLVPLVEAQPSWPAAPSLRCARRSDGAIPVRGASHRMQQSQAQPIRYRLQARLSRKSVASERTPTR
jgi:hypothetical protein